MSRLLASFAGIALALAAAAAPAAAQVVATDPVETKPAPPPDPDPTGDLVIATDPDAPPPDPQPDQVAVPVPDPYIQEPYYPDPQPIADPVAPPEDYSPNASTIVFGAASQMNTSNDQGFGHAGWGGTVGFGYLERHGDTPTGFEVSGTFLSGPNLSIYDLSARLIASPKIGNRALVPYVAFGFCAGASRLVTDRQRMTGEHVAFGLGIGPSASIGVHGFVLGKKGIYWRAGAGFLGAGVGAVTADLAIGMVMGK